MTDVLQDPCEEVSSQSRVGTSARPSDDLAPGFIIYFVQDSLLFYGQDGVTDWRTTG